MNFIEFQEKFATEKDVIDYYIDIKYRGNVACPRCGSVQVSRRQNNPRFFQCNGCNNSFSVFTGTIFEKSTTDLRKWMYALHLLLNGKKGISGLQLQREIGVTYKTAWRMLKQIRTAMGNTEESEKFRTIVEIDECYVGGKPRKKNKRDDDNHKGGGAGGSKRGRGTKKTPIVGLIERTSKMVHARVALPDKNGRKLSSRQLFRILEEVCDPNTTVISDEFSGYRRLNQSDKFIHFEINHSERFARGFVHTNNIESFWATLKRGIYGIYHHVSVKHLQSYINEFCFRYNNRQNDSMFDQVLIHAAIA